MDLKLNDILANVQSKDRQANYRDVLSQILAGPNMQKEIQTFLEHVVQESLGLLLSRLLFQDFINGFHQKAEELPVETALEIWQFCLALLATRAVAFEEQISQVREIMADIYESSEDWSEAANILKGRSV